MWATSAAFDTALRSNSRRWRTKLDVMYGGSIVESLDTMVSGYIGIDDVAVRREAHFTIVDADGNLTPAKATDLLTPKGTEIRIYRGLALDSGEYEDVPLGLFGIVTPEVRGHSDGTVIEVKGFDRVDTIRQRQFIDPWVIANNTPIHTAIANLITSRLPGVTTRITASPYVVPEMSYDRLTDPWEAVKDLVEAGAMAAYFDQNGSFVVEPAQEFETGFTYEVGADSMLMTSARSFDASKTYSGVIVRGEHPDFAPVRYDLWDTDTASPTYAFGPFGQRPYGVYSKLITTAGQAQAVAEALLPKVSRIRQECTITVAGHPGHDVGDVLTIVDPRSKTSGRWTVVSGTIPLRTQQGEHVRLRCKEAL